MGIFRLPHGKGRAVVLDRALKLDDQEAKDFLLLTVNGLEKEKVHDIVQ